MDEEMDKREEEKEKEGEEIQDLTMEELTKQWKKLKMEKTSREGIENEAWKYMPREIGEVLGRLLNSMWKNGKLSEDWNRGTISPIFKKGEKNEVSNYRGVTLMSTEYKIYANILNDKLIRAVEDTRNAIWIQEKEER